MPYLRVTGISKITLHRRECMCLSSWLWLSYRYLFFFFLASAAVQGLKHFSFLSCRTKAILYRVPSNCVQKTLNEFDSQRTSLTFD